MIEQVQLRSMLPIAWMGVTTAVGRLRLPALVFVRKTRVEFEGVLYHDDKPFVQTL